MTTKELDKQYVANTYNRFPVEIVSGKGATLKDENGKEYVDMGAGIAVNTFGMADEGWVAAVTAQLGKFQHTSNLYYTEPCARLVEMLCTRTGMKKVFFGNSGAEANECAIKAAREYGITKKGGEYYNIITLKNSFHGRTLATLAATGQDVFHEHFCPMPEGFLYVAANDCAELEKTVEENKVCAIMFELVQGEGGVNALDAAFVAKIAELCEKHDLLMVDDEVQCGNGRTGELYAYMHFGITPDIVTTAKGLGAGLPIGAVMFGEKAVDIYKPGLHGSTFGGNPVCAAGACHVLSRLTDELMADVSAKSKYIKDALAGASGIKSVSGMGLMLGVETEKKAGDVVAAAMEKGVLLLTAKTKVRLLPPLNISYAELDKAIKVIKEVCEI
ncbi:MAG: aspartate aminotransferase family protein [Clostridia bacterium]|nr:aspartate aminotransferase family protein [Clostridia bacterium]